MGCCGYAPAYRGTGTNSYELELLDNQSKSLQKISGNVGANDGIYKTMRFKTNVRIKPNYVYTLKLLIKGSKIKYGAEGKKSVTGPDGTNFVFSDSRINNVNYPNPNNPTIIGQIPLIQYFSEPNEGRRLQVRVIFGLVPSMEPILAFMYASFVKINSLYSHFC